jgi:tetrameric-type glycyl-tRNA synthetase beta subunit
LAAFLRWVDELTTGAHFFSADHEAEARSTRPSLPHRVLHLPHPRFALPALLTTSVVTTPVVAGSVGLLGRLRSYKRTVGFARAYLQALGDQARMVVAGHADEPEVHRGLAELAVQYPGLDYQPGFLPEEGFWRLLSEVEWVALPYRRLYSSGVLVAALQLGRRIISPVPTGGTNLYGTGLDQGRWRTLQPWDDTRAVEELLAVRAHVPPAGELALPSWPEAAGAMAGFYAQLVQDAATPAARSTRTGSAAPKGRTPVPVHARSTDGEVFDFGTHANDFLVRREESLATETFLVRVPGGGAVPAPVHNDMEQTFVFISGVGEATLSRDGEQARRFGCVPGDVVFVPAGWRHTVLAQSVEGLVYLTVNSFVPGAERVGASAVAHAVTVQPSFRASGHAPGAAHAEPLAIFRSAETAFRVDEGGRRMWPRDFTALDTTLRQDPNTYRVRRLGPFEYVKSVTARPRILTTELADRLFAAASGHLPVLVEGSQSPISVKAPCEESDLDLLVAVQSGDELTLARKVPDGLAAQQDHVPVPLSLGVVHARWLDLPNFYSALSLDPAAPDRRWWTAADPDRLGEATRRIRRGLDLLQDPDTVRSVLAEAQAAREQLSGLVVDALAGTRLPHGALTVLATPRRLVAIVEQVAGRETDHTRLTRGPKLSAAFGPDGAPTPAASGFARAHGVAVDNLERAEVNGVQHLVLHRHEPGRPVLEALSGALAGVVSGLRAAKNMRWRDPRLSFTRPIRWLLALWGDDVVPVRASTLAADRSTWVLRTATTPVITVGAAEEYLDDLHAAGILLDPAERRDQIVTTATELAATVGGRIDTDAESALIDELTYLIESPTPLLGHFDPDYLRLPEAVLATVMRTHQRYLPVRDTHGALLPCFVAVANGPIDTGAVRAGNEAVLRARYEDAAFFHRADLAVTPAQLRHRLRGLSFADRLGSLHDRADRIAAIAADLTNLIELDEQQRHTLERARKLTKFDLGSQLVTELTSLAGVMAREYATAAGEGPTVAQALYEAELPRHAGDHLPTTPAGAILSLADRLDYLAGLATTVGLPTGSSDPFALRRAALGVLALHRTQPALSGLSLLDALTVAARHQPLDVPPAVLNDVAAFLTRRLEQALAEEGRPLEHIRVALVHAERPARTDAILTQLAALAGTPEFDRLVQTMQRARRIVPPAPPLTTTPVSWPNPPRSGYTRPSARPAPPSTESPTSTTTPTPPPTSPMPSPSSSTRSTSWTTTPNAAPPDSASSPPSPNSANKPSPGNICIPDLAVVFVEPLAVRHRAIRRGPVSLLLRPKLRRLPDDRDGETVVALDADRLDDRRAHQGVGGHHLGEPPRALHVGVCVVLVGHGSAPHHVVHNDHATGSGQAD